MKVAVIASAGGSTLVETASACPHVKFDCITDRDCGAEREARRLGMRHARIEDGDNAGFSIKASVQLERWGRHDAIVTIFSRLLTAPLVGNRPLLNVHPSLLPAFRGLGAVSAAKEAGAKEFGATLHGLTNHIDSGPIVAQVRSPLDAAMPLERLRTLSFLHKVYVFIEGIELLERGALRFEGGTPIVAPDQPGNERATPCLTDPRYVEHMRAACAREGFAPL